MRRVFGVVTCGVMLPVSAAASTPVATGTLAGHVTWTASASPYSVQGDLTIATGAELDIEPGVEVRFANHDPDAGGLDTARVELVVEGALVAEGTAAMPILLGAAEGDFPNSWSGIRVASGAERVSLAHVSIEAATTALDSAAPAAVLSLTACTLRKSFDGLHLRAGRPLLEALSLESNSVSGISAEATTSGIELELGNSVVRLNGSYGVLLRATQGQRLSAVIASSTVYGNTSAGVTSEVQGAGSELALTVSNSIVSGNGILGIDAARSALDDGALTATVRYSDVYGNGMDFSGAAPGEGCITEDPLFVDAPWDLRLSATSPCIGSADPLSESRDMGAYAYERSPSIGGEGGAPQAGAGGGEQAGEGGEGGSQAGEAGVTQAAPTPTLSDGSGCSCRATPHSRLTGAALLLVVGLVRARA